MKLSNDVDVVNMQKCNMLKRKLKKQFKKLDDHKTTYMNTKIFFETLNLSQVTLSKLSENELVKRYGKNDKILFKEALARLSIDMMQENPLGKDWIIRGNEPDDCNTSLRSSIYSRNSQMSRTSRFSKTPDLYAPKNIQVSEPIPEEMVIDYKKLQKIDLSK